MICKHGNGAEGCYLCQEEYLKGKTMSELTGTKRWYESSGVMSAAAGVIAAAFAMVMALKPGLVTAEESTTIQQNIPAALGSVLAIVSCVKAIIGRLKAKETIG